MTEVRKKCTVKNTTPNKTEATNNLESELDIKNSVIKSMEVAHNTLHDLIEDKDEIIRSQKTIIEGVQKDLETNIAARLRSCT